MLQLRANTSTVRDHSHPLPAASYHNRINIVLTDPHGIDCHQLYQPQHAHPQSGPRHQLLAPRRPQLHLRLNEGRVPQVPSPAGVDSCVSIQFHCLQAMVFPETFYHS
jgi:hypothetical protein